MARVLLSSPQMTLSGKINKSDNVYFRTVRGKTFMCHAPSRRTRKYRPEEIERLSLFAMVSRQTTVLLKDPRTRQDLETLWSRTGKKKYPTLRGFVFSTLYRDNSLAKLKQKWYHQCISVLKNLHNQKISSNFVLQNWKLTKLGGRTHEVTAIFWLLTPADLKP